MISRKSLLIVASLLLITTDAFAVFEFKVKVGCGAATCSGTEDYSTPITAVTALESAVNLTDGSVECGSWDGQSGSNIADGAAVTWNATTSSGTLVHMTNHSGTSDDYYMIITAGDTLEDDDTVTDSTNSFDINGVPDSCSIKVDSYSEDGDFAPGQMHDITCDIDNNIIVTCENDKHDGTSSGAGCTFSGTGGFGNVSVENPFMIFEWFYVAITSSSELVAYSSCNDCHIRNNILDGVNSSSGDEGIDADSWVQASKVISIYNNIIFDTTADGIEINGALRGAEIYNNTIYNAGERGLNLLTADSSNLVYNNLILGSTNEDYDTGGTQDYNISSDGTATGSNSITQAVDTDYFVNIAGNDYHLKAGAPAIDIGLTISGTVSNDIDDDTRTGDYDIGADEFVAAGAGDGKHNAWRLPAINVPAIY